MTVGYVCAPLFIAGSAGIYLLELLEIRQRTGTDYNDYFAIPLAFSVIALGLVDFATSAIAMARRSDGREALRRHRGRGVASRFGWLRRPAAVFAILIVGYLVLNGALGFVVPSLLFGSLAMPALAYASGRGSEISVRGWAAWTLVVGALVAAVTMFFSAALGIRL